MITSNKWLVTVETARALLITKVTRVSKVDDTRHISTSY